MPFAMLPAATPTPVTAFWILAPIVAALAFIVAGACLPEPARQKASAVLVASAGAVYAAGGFGLAEVGFCVLLLALAYRGLADYRALGLAWLLHGIWDLAHDLWGNPILPYVPQSSFACLVYDPVVAAWYLLGAPGLARRNRASAAALTR